MVDFVNFFFEYILQGVFLLLFVLFGISLILMMINWIITLGYIFFKRPDIKEKLVFLGFIPRVKSFGFSINKEYFNDPFIKKHKKRTLFFLKAALGIWLIFAISIMLIGLISIFINY